MRSLERAVPIIRAGPISLSFLPFTAADRPKRNAACVHFLRCAFAALCGGRLAGRAVVCCRKAPEFFFPSYGRDERRKTHAVDSRRMN